MKTKAYKDSAKKYNKIKSETIRDEVIKKCGKECCVCKEEIDFSNGHKWARHHISYQNNEYILVCRGCHMWLHGQSNVYNHIIKKRYDKDISPYIFAKCVVDVYETNNPMIKEEIMRMELDREE